MDSYTFGALLRGGFGAEAAKWGEPDTDLLGLP